MNEGIRILVVDDDYDVRQALREVLERNGYKVDVAQNAAQALMKLRTQSFDVVFTDIAMAGTNGFLLLSLLRTIHLSIDCVVVTGNDSPDNRHQALLLGAKGYLVKPFNVDELLSLVQTIIRDRKKKKDS